MNEGFKFVGVLGWVVGIPLAVFGNLALGLVLILVGAVMSGWALLDGAKRREARRNANNPRP